MATVGFSNESTTVRPPIKQTAPGTAYNQTATVPYGSLTPQGFYNDPTWAGQNAALQQAPTLNGVYDVNQQGVSPQEFAQVIRSVEPSGDNSGYNPANTDAMTGAMAAYGYTPGGLASLYDNPAIMTNDLLAAMGITNPGMANQLGQYMDPAVSAQFLLNRGKNTDDNDVLNFVNEYLQQMVTPGGRQPELDRLVAELLGGRTYDPENPDASNPLGAYLNADLTPEEQIKVANAMFGQTLSGQSPYAQTAYQRFARDQGNQYLSGMAKGAPQGENYLDFLHQGPLAGWVRGS